MASKVIKTPTARKRDARRDRACTAERTSRQQQQQRQQRGDREKITCEYTVCRNIKFRQTIYSHTIFSRSPRCCCCCCLEVSSTVHARSRLASRFRAVGAYMAFLGTPVVPPHWGTTRDGSSAKAIEGSAPLRGCYRRVKEGHISNNCTETRRKA